MLPFVQKLEWWQNGLAGSWPSLICYIAGVCRFYRLARHFADAALGHRCDCLLCTEPQSAYLATTAMTSRCFLRC